MPRNHPVFSRWNQHLLNDVLSYLDRSEDAPRYSRTQVELRIVEPPTSLSDNASAIWPVISIGVKRETQVEFSKLVLDLRNHVLALLDEEGVQSTDSKLDVEVVVSEPVLFSEFPALWKHLFSEQRDDVRALHRHSACLGIPIKIQMSGTIGLVLQKPIQPNGDKYDMFGITARHVAFGAEPTGLFVTEEVVRSRPMGQASSVPCSQPVPVFLEMEYPYEVAFARLINLIDRPYFTAQQRSIILELAHRFLPDQFSTQPKPIGWVIYSPDRGKCDHSSDMADFAVIRFEPDFATHLRSSGHLLDTREENIASVHETFSVALLAEALYLKRLLPQNVLNMTSVDHVTQYNIGKTLLFKPLHAVTSLAIHDFGMDPILLHGRTSGLRQGTILSDLSEATVQGKAGLAYLAQVIAGSDRYLAAEGDSGASLIGPEGQVYGFVVGGDTGGSKWVSVMPARALVAHLATEAYFDNTVLASPPDMPFA